MSTLIVHPIKAQVLFFDNFNSENGGVPTLNYYNFANWTVTRGSVDLIGNGFFDFFPGNGLYIDTEGTTGIGGTMVTKQSFSFVPGMTYTLSCDLAGDQRDGLNKSEIITVGNSGSIFSTDITLPSSYPYTLFSFQFTVMSPTNSPLSFAAGEDGDIGLILDNVQLSAVAVPEPGALSFLMAGGVLVGGLAMAKRRHAKLRVMA